jgi:hypothetical protein
MAYASAVVLTPVDITRAGKAAIKPLVTPTATHGNKFVNDGKTFLLAQNSGASPVTLTFDVTAQVDGLDVPDLVITLAATGDANGLDTQMIGPFTTNFQQSDGYVWVVTSTITNVKIGAFRQ